MKNETKESQNTARASVVINIHGGNNQILPNATEVVQNFYGAEFRPCENTEQWYGRERGG